MKALRYPSGAIASVGDLVWWNGGKSVGRVVNLYNELDAAHQLDINESCVEISNDLSLPKPERNGVIYPESSFSDDGIDRLKPSQEEEVKRLLREELEGGADHVWFEFDANDLRWIPYTSK